jgi:hypothetical protein
VPELPEGDDVLAGGADLPLVELVLERLHDGRRVADRVDQNDAETPAKVNVTNDQYLRRFSPIFANFRRKNRRFLQKLPEFCVKSADILTDELLQYHDQIFEIIALHRQFYYLYYVFTPL